MNIYAVKDIKAQLFNAPFFQSNNVTALRTFAMEVNRSEPNNVLHTNPEDFELYCLGEFDNASGVITPAHKPDLIGTASALIKGAIK